MEKFQAITYLIIYGARDCVTGILSIRRFLSSKKEPIKTSHGENRTSLSIISQCFIFGLTYCLVAYIFDKIILGSVLDYLATYFGSTKSVYWVRTFFSIMFNVSWTWPLFCMSRILYYSWYQEIADLTCKNVGVKREKNVKLSYSLSDQVTSAFVQVLFLGQSYLVFLLPVPYFLKEVICIFHLSMLYALYAFEYKWFNQGYAANKRLAFVDAKWPYFVGFGLPLAVVTSYSSASYMHSMCIFSTLFPLCLISSTVTINAELKNFNMPLRIFRLVNNISEYIVCKIFRFLRR